MLRDPVRVTSRNPVRTTSCNPGATACCNDVVQRYVVRENSFVMIQLTISSIATPCTDGHTTQCSYPHGVPTPNLISHAVQTSRKCIPHGMVSHTAWYRTRHSIHMRCHAAAHVPSSAEHGSRRPFFALRSQPSPGADVAGARPVPVQMWHSRAGLPSRYDVAVAAPRQRHKCSLSRFSSLRRSTRSRCCMLHVARCTSPPPAAPLHSIEMPFGRTST